MNKRIVPLILVLIIVAAGSVITFNLYHYLHPNKTVSRVSAIMLKLSPQEITNQSDGVILGTVESIQAEKVPSKFKSIKDSIATNAVVTVEKYLFNPKNFSSTEIIVQTLGGTIGSQSTVAEDFPAFEKGQHVIVFLRQKDDKIFSVFGGLQGKYTVNNDNVAVGEKEQEVFNNVFGKQMTLDEFEKQIGVIVSSSTPQK
jgi:hypothetical protein